MTRRLIAVLLGLFLLAAPLAAQDRPQIDYNAWKSFAEQAQSVAQNGQAPERDLMQMREELVVWRDRFQSAQNANASRIGTLKEQISALGPAPKEGETEASDIAARRKELNEKLAELQAPGLNATEAYSQADALIKQIDSNARERQAAALSRLSPSPLNPANWPDALGQGTTLLRGMAVDAKTGISRGNWDGARLPAVLGYLAAALLLLTLGRRWIDSLPTRLGALITSTPRRAAMTFLVSLGQIAIPLIGIYLGVSALDASGLFGDWTRPFLIALPTAGLLLFGGRWIARQVFPDHHIAYATISLPDDKRKALRITATTLALLMALHHLLAQAGLPVSGLFQAPADLPDRVPIDFSEATAAVLHYPLIVLAALALFRLGNIQRRIARWDRHEPPRYRVRILAWAGNLSRLVAVVAVAAGGIGYIAAANGLIWPWIITLGLIGVLLLLQDFTADLFALLSRQDSAREGLGPVLIGFALVLLSAPVFALVWGARPTDLSELWATVQQGVSLGGIKLSPSAILTFMAVFAVGYALTRVVQGMLRTTVLPRTRLDAGGQNAVVSGLGYVGIGLAAIVAVTSAGIDLSSLAIVAGALSVGIGFGLQNIVSNFVSGIILLIERPISVGDWIDAGGQQGIVKRISVRSTSVETFDKTEVIVPNADLVSQPVTNWTRGNQTGRIIIPVGVAYGTDTRKVERILREVIEAQPVVTIDPPPAVLFRGLGADSLDFEVRAILSDVTAGLGTTSEVLHQIVARFAEEGIEIPFVQRDIWLRNPEALQGKAQPATAAEPWKSAPELPQKVDSRLAMDDDGDGDS